MISELDQYYTPVSVAYDVINAAGIESPGVCVDSTCGEGSLLGAASSIYGDVRCVGLDRDRNAIKRLRRQNPDWVLSVADILDNRSFTRTGVVGRSLDYGLLLLNPPFSHRGNKSVQVFFEGREIRCSVAMAYILRSIDYFSPCQGAVIFAPESILYSDTDSGARLALKGSFVLDVIAELENTTFKGARARVTAVKLLPGCTESHDLVNNSSVSDVVEGALVRGGLPVYKAESNSAGIPFVHTKHLNMVAWERKWSCLPKVSTNCKGRIKGWTVLLPRVGVPILRNAKAVYIPSEVQLSDCVIALRMHSKDIAKEAQLRLHLHWDGLVDLYRGTGARYITIARLQEWLTSIGIVCKVA